MDPGDVLDHDPRLSADDALHLKADRTLGAGREIAHRGGAHGRRQRPAQHGLADLTDLGAERPGQQADLATPHRRRD